MKAKTVKTSKKAIPSDNVTDIEMDISSPEHSTINGKLTTLQEQYLLNEKTEEEVEYLKSLHADESDMFSMDT